MKFIKQLFIDTKVLFNANMVLIQPLILFFMLVLIILMPVSSKLDFSQDSYHSLKVVLVVLFCIGLISVVFNAGWYNMFYKCIKTPVNPNLTKPELAVKSLSLFKEFFPGVALYFPRFLGGSLLYLAVIAIIILLVYNIGIAHIGIPIGVSWGKFLDSEESYESLQNYLLNLSPGIQYQIARWELLIIGAMLAIFIFNYLTIFWAQLILFYDINPVKAYLKSFKTVLKYPLRAFIISLSFAFSLQICLIVFSIPFILLQFLGIIMYVFIVGYFNLMIFVYLERFNKPKSNNNCGTDCFR